MVDDMVLGLVQMQSTRGDIPGNLARINSFCQKAQAHGVDLLCFPELSVTGYHGAAQLAQPLSGFIPQSLSRMARRYGLSICAGFAETSAEGKPYLSQLLCTPEGQIFSYHKTHLGRRELESFAPGDVLPVFKTPKAKVGIALCLEAHYPEIASTLVLRGAEVLLYPFASPLAPRRRRESWSRTLSARAYDAGAYVGCCNALGPCGDRARFSGGAMVFDPRGQVLAESFGEEGELTVASLPGQPLNRLREKGMSSMKEPFFLAGRRPELYR